MNAWPLLWILIATSALMCAGWAWQRVHGSALHYRLVLPRATLPRSLGALIGKSLADRQLATHRRDPSNNKRQAFRGGIWRYSRHPNYFFEFLHWFSQALHMRGDDYAGYQRTTSPFLPLPPKP